MKALLEAGLDLIVALSVFLVGLSLAWRRADAPTKHRGRALSAFDVCGAPALIVLKNAIEIDRLCRGF